MTKNFYLLKESNCWKYWLNISVWNNNVKPSRGEWTSANNETRSSSPAVVSPFGSGLCFLHVLVIVKHNNGFYKLQFTSLVIWIIQREWQREGESAAQLRWVLHLRWQATEDGILSKLFIWFPSTFPQPSLYFLLLSTSITCKCTHIYTHTANSHIYFMRR